MKTVYIGRRGGEVDRKGESVLGKISMAPKVYLTRKTDLTITSDNKHGIHWQPEDSI